MKLFKEKHVEASQNILSDSFEEYLKNVIFTIPSKEDLGEVLAFDLADFLTAQTPEEKIQAFKNLYLDCIFGTATILAEEEEKAGKIKLEEISEEEFEKMREKNDKEKKNA